jgi:4-hydroxy-3-methylbut-2-en-1-yl diphosphate reductase
MGLCFGIKDAIQLTEEIARNEPVTIFGPLAHNASIQNRLVEKGVQFADKHQDARTETLIVTAHGTSDRMRREMREAGFQVQDATCPLVHFAHRSLMELVKEGYYPVIIGKADHIEVRGLTGDLDTYTIVLNHGDIKKIPNVKRIGIMSQTTQPMDRVQSLVEKIKLRFPQAEIRFTDTVCHPTKQRQKAAIDLGQESDVVIVIGGKTSNNTRQLSDTVSRFCERVHQIENVADLCESWFQSDDNVGITAGTSTPDEVIQPVIQQLNAWNSSWSPILSEANSKVFVE